MQIKEGEPQPQDVNYQKLISDYKAKGFIRDGSPFWWSTDYAPDPREYVPFTEFRERLVHLGERNIIRRVWPGEILERTKDVYLYPNPDVPIAILPLEINGDRPQFLVTARPYHEKELHWNPLALTLIRDVSIDKGPEESLRDHDKIQLPDHFYPHIRGLFAGKRGTHFFWYPIHWGDIIEERLGELVSTALEDNNLSFLDIYYNGAQVFEERTYVPLWKEIQTSQENLIERNPIWINFDAKEVSAEEFIAATEKHEEENLILYYPLRVEEFQETLSLVITSQSHSVGKNGEILRRNKLQKTAILGVYAESGGHGRCRFGGILRIKNREFALKISKLISEDFGSAVDTVLFTPQKGRPKYERISP